MRRILPSLLFFVLATGFAVHAQTISITTTNTPSICYNDGSLTINATGGTAPYTDSILSGPSNPNLTYPIALPTGQYTFTDLPHGTFTVVVHDAAGHSGTFAASVGGTYTFPSDTLYQQSYYINTFGNNYTPDTLYCQAQGGLPPYSYAISSIGANTGFGAYQSLNYFMRLCSGTYWVRLRDSCGNIFTNNVIVTHTVFTYPSCVNSTTGDITLEAQGGVGPYTFVVKDSIGTALASNQTGIFTGLPALDKYTFSATDSCGGTYTYYYYNPEFYFSSSCPFDSSLTLQIFATGAFTPYIVTCTNCAPVQRDTIRTYPFTSPLFGHLPLLPTYDLSISDACGNHYAYTVSSGNNLIPYPVNTSCNSVTVTTYYQGFVPVPAQDLDSVVLYADGHRYVSLIGYFSHLPNTNLVSDTFVSYMSGGCTGTTIAQLKIPYFNPAYMYPAHGPNCEQVITIDLGNGWYDNPETYYLISPSHDTTAETPHGGYNGAFFWDMSPSTTYQLVSDSGCSGDVFTYAYPTFEDTVTSYVSCTGQPVVKVVNTIQISNPSSSSDFYLIKWYLNDSLILAPDTGMFDIPFSYVEGHYKTFDMTDSGLYKYKMYLILPTEEEDDSDYLSNHHVLFYNLNTIYDSICPFDTGYVYVTTSTVPFPYVNTAYACNGVLPSPPILTIYGGSIPYTVQIAGVDTIIMNTNSTVFPDTALGTYNVIAYDNCGISRSFTFSIRDTCVCGIPTNVWSYANEGFHYQFSDSITGGGSGPFTYIWNFGDGATANTSNASHIYSKNGTDTVTLIVTDPCGSDTVMHAINVVNGIDNMQFSNDVSIYPDPNQGSFMIGVSGISSGNLTAEITDMVGRYIYSQCIHSGENKFDLNLAAGVYLVKVTDGVNETVRRVSIR